MTNETKKIDWKKIWSFIKSKVFIAIIILILIGFSAYQYSMIQDLKRQLDIDEQNIIALNDSIEYHITKNGELQASIAAYIASEKELKTLNRELYDRIKEQDGKIISLGHAIIQLKQDSLTLEKYLVEKDKLIEHLLKIDDHTYVAPWTLKYQYDSTNFDIFTGKTYIGVSNKNPLELIHVDTRLIERLTQIDLTWGQKIDKGVLRVFIQSNYPGFTAAQLEGVLIDPNTNPYIKKLIKEKKWFNGFSVGVGATGGFNITTGKYGLVVGPTIMYNIYNF
jgi:energy-coupling factor transporter transmembrane protein EcfT